MSKSNMLLGLAKGKVGDLVFYRDGGEQRTRTRVVPKNPRTPAQMRQRAKIANVSALYRTMASVLADSFTNRPSNQSGYNVFASTAIGLAPYMTKRQAAAACVLPQPAIVSRGTLPTLEYAVADDISDGAPALAVTAQLGAESTIAQLSTALIAQYPSIQQGDELTFISVRFEAIEGADAEALVYAAYPSVLNVKVDTEDNTLLSAAGLTYGQNVVSSISIANDFNETNVMQAIIHSRVDGNGQIQTSTQWAVLDEDAQALYDGYRTEAAITAAIESYMAGAEPVLR